ncbi:F0F1 ATP synthase subunit B [Candidatus Legionella polyplacis]|uniref:ATP synthase subunit b n=1 Tax=Candidatus Legionella polyplacis TaxID=2005262 RepID=A0ABZ2H0W3_9GAMM
MKLDINLTFFIQIVVFAVFIWFMTKFIWPPLEKIIEERKNKIIKDFSEAESNKKEWSLMKDQITLELEKAKEMSNIIISKANERAFYLIEKAKKDARNEADQYIKGIKEYLDKEVINVKNELRKNFGCFVILAVEKIISREVNKKDHEDLLNFLIKEI